MPVHRSRRLRKSEVLRDLTGETVLTAKDFLQPYFVIEGKNKKTGIDSMPGVYRFSVDNLLKDIADIGDIPGIILFGVTDQTDERGSAAWERTGIVQSAVKAVKREFKDLVVMTDVCLCGYTSHGHCGVLSDTGREIDNDKTLALLARTALSHAVSGADMVAPSAMMDHQVGSIREVLDKEGFLDTGILAYSAKYASNFYGPFRSAARSTPAFGDRKTYQMDVRNSSEAMKEINRDIAEGADIVMVKPALSYLDIIYRAKNEFNVPIAAYNVSGEYAMIKGMSGGSPETEKALAIEVLTSIKRAGADIIISYFAKEAAKWIK